MGENSPVDELNEIIKLCDEKKLPHDAGEWAANARDTVEDILESIDSMREAGADAPTDAQSRALKNIYEAARRWLDGRRNGQDSDR